MRSTHRRVESVVFGMEAMCRRCACVFSVVRCVHARRSGNRGQVLWYCGFVCADMHACRGCTEAARVAAAIHMRRATPPPGRPILLSRSTIHHFFPRVFPVYDGHIASLPEHEPRFHVWRSPSSFISAAQLGADALSSLPLLSFLRTLSPTANRRLVLNTDAAAPVLVSVGRFVVLFDRCLLGAALVPLLTCMVLQ